MAGYHWITEIRKTGSVIAENGQSNIALLGGCVLRIQVDLQILGKLRRMGLLQHAGVPARHIEKHLCPSPHKLGSLGGKSQIFVRVYLSRVIGGVWHSGRAPGVCNT